MDAEASSRSAPGWLLSDGREPHSPNADQEASWAQASVLHHFQIQVRIPQNFCNRMIEATTSLGTLEEEQHKYAYNCSALKEGGKVFVNT